MEWNLLENIRIHDFQVGTALIYKMQNTHIIQEHCK